MSYKRSGYFRFGMLLVREICSEWVHAIFVFGTSVSLQRIPWCNENLVVYFRRAPGFQAGVVRDGLGLSPFLLLILFLPGFEP